MNRLRIYLDINETLIRTGESSRGDQLAEIDSLWQIREIFLEWSRCGHGIDLVLITGNSFEYSRRVEEPLGLKNLLGVNFYIISENGLIVRGLNNGIGWRVYPTKQYTTEITRIISYLDQNFPTTTYLQGNEIRLTIKPVGDTFETSTLDNLRGFLEQADIQQSCQVYYHRFYVDIDPRFISRSTNEEDIIPFYGKGWAVDEMELKLPPAKLMAIGDSASDFPMYAAILSRGGRSLHVANGCELDCEFASHVIRLKKSYTRGVLEALEQWLK